MHFKRAVLGLGVLSAILSGIACGAHAQGISQHVAVCDPKFPTRCVKPAADGSQPITGTITSVAGVLGVATTDKSGTITAGGSAQNAIASNASRKGWCIQNTDASEALYVRVGGTASATAGTKLTAGTQACSSPTLIDTGAVSVFAATTAHPFSGFETQ